MVCQLVFIVEQFNPRLDFWRWITVWQVPQRQILSML
jgi:hypothetical protein